jgi:transposase
MTLLPRRTQQTWCLCVLAVGSDVGLFPPVERVRQLADRSRAPHHCPRQLAAHHEARIVHLKRRLPAWSARRLKRDIDLPYAEKTIRRVCRDHGLNRRYRRRKHQTTRLP